MLPYASWRPAAVLALIGVICLPLASPAAGQNVRSASELASALPDDFFYLGEPPGSETDAAEPTAAPGVPKKPGPSDTEAAPPQRRPSPPARQPARPTDMTSMLASRGPIMRLASMPNMFGDSYGYQLQVADVAGIQTVDIPPPGGTRRFKISENDKALPMDRVFFTYNHFQDAVEASIVDLGVESYPIDQYTIGLEKTFRDKLWSVELRLPFGRTPHVTGRKLEVDSGDVGNLSVTVKRLLFATPTTVLGIGLPIETPTGGDVTGEGAVSSYTLSNEAVHLAPFIGFLNAPNDRVFSEGFLQVDVPTNGNRVSFGDSQLGKLTEQTLLYVDLALGYWVYRNPYAHYLTGLAAMVEYHYTTTLEDAEIVSGTDGSQILQFGNTLNRMDISDLTIGLHTELGKTTVRVGGAFPLSGASNRLYDAEVHVSVNRRF
jgi:hypothetical protein